MKAEILCLIRNSKDGIRARDICEKLNISTKSLERVVSQLVNEGYDIDTEDNRIVMYSYPEILSSAEIRSRLTTKWAAKNVYYRMETESTNDEAMSLAEDGKEHGSLVVAEHQNAGRGRRGRSWSMNRGESIAMSMILRPKLAPDRASIITLVMAVSVAEVLQKLTDKEVRIKWPNDVLIDKKKVCGILTEMSAVPGKVNHVVIGVGINVNQSEMPEDISRIATSLLIENGNRSGRSDIVVGIMDYFEYYYDMVEAAGDLSCLVDIYDGYLINKEAEVRILDPKGEYNAVAQGINDYGELIIQKEDGSFDRISSGEVSVRGVYGYV